MLHEYFGNIHMHTTYSDGEGSFDDLVVGAHKAKLDFVYVTDHNILVRTQEEGYRQGVLTMVGQEVHDGTLALSQNHLLCLGVSHDVTHHAPDTQRLINAVDEQNALSFLAHPVEVYTDFMPSHHPWTRWDVTGYTGVELWNYMSVFRGFATSKLRAIYMVFMPHRFTTGPLPGMLRKWDELTQTRAVPALGGTDVHSTTYHLGPLSRRFLPYDHCARALNTHIVTDTPMLGPTENNIAHDHQIVLDALRTGHCWTGYDLAGSTAGFRFSAWQSSLSGMSTLNETPDAIMGDMLEIPKPGEETRFLVEAPAKADIRLLCNGKVVAQELNASQLHYVTPDAGVYRVEVWRQRWGKPRGWIFSNPIYVRG
ncbi:MAG: CehA/McbA family metallohydrolase [Chloroflexota bacterium]